MEKEEEEMGCFHGIAVDQWTFKKNKVFFLTHMHADHLKGLSERWHRGLIYCSTITASLLLLKFPGFDRSLVHPLPLSTPCLVPLPSKSISNALLEVTLIDADHCPGSVMFVFRGTFGCILHTGDFRWERTSPKYHAIKDSISSAIGGSQVNVLCMDNTFCNPRFIFPPRDVAAQRVIDMISSHEGYDVIISVDMLGKEELLLFIADALQTKICVWPQRLRIMSHLGIAEHFTTDTTITRIRAVPRYSVSLETVQMLNMLRPTIAIVPSGLSCLSEVALSDSCCSGMLDEEFVSDQHNVCYLRRTDSRNKKSRSALRNMFFVPYSLHSSFHELETFLEFIGPISVKGNKKSLRMDISPQNLYEFYNQVSFESNPTDKKVPCSSLRQCFTTVGKAMSKYMEDGENEYDYHAKTHKCLDGRSRSQLELRSIAVMRSKHAWASHFKRKRRGANLELDKCYHDTG